MRRFGLLEDPACGRTGGRLACGLPLGHLSPSERLMRERLICQQFGSLSANRVGKYWLVVDVIALYIYN